MFHNFLMMKTIIIVLNLEVSQPMIDDSSLASSLRSFNLLQSGLFFHSCLTLAAKKQYKESA